MDANCADYKKFPVYFMAPYLSELMNKDWFDDSVRPDMYRDYHNNTMRKPSYFIWDDWFCPVEQDVQYDDIIKKPGFTKIKEFSHYDSWGDKQRKTILFKVE
jgi:hypothetical protein